MERAVVIGASAGGLNALAEILSELMPNYPFPVIVIQHRGSDQSQLLEHVLQHKCKIRIKQADEKEALSTGVVYIAPPGYHLLIERDKTLSLTADNRVNHSMPSIDVTFESAAEVFRKGLVGIILTGASSDGANGIVAIKKSGGITIAQDLKEAHHNYMPGAAIDTKMIDRVLTLQEISRFIIQLAIPYEK
jgi:two-component system, chemotaxis family, protein-glutamate methylesterase/glutaminase